MFLKLLVKKVLIAEPGLTLWPCLKEILLRVGFLAFIINDYYKLFKLESVYHW